MDLDTLRALPMADQMTFLRGRIVSEALSMEAVARFLHLVLHGGTAFDDAIDTPQQFTTLIGQCRDLASEDTAFSPHTRPRVLAAINKAEQLYKRRNRFVHDLLHHDLLSERHWQLTQLSRTKQVGEPYPDPEPVTADQMVSLVLELTETKWRLRGALWSYLGSSDEVSPFLTHPFTAGWDGTFQVTSGDNSAPAEPPVSSPSIASRGPELDL